MKYRTLNRTAWYRIHDINERMTLACLQEGGDGQGGNRAVRVGDQVLEVEIARRDRGRMGH